MRIDLTADSGVATLIRAWSHTFMENGHEIISIAILLPYADSIKNGCSSLSTTTELSILLTSCLTAIKNLITKYCTIVYEKKSNFFA